MALSGSNLLLRLRLVSKGDFETRGSCRETAMHAETCQNLNIETKSINKLRLRCAEFLRRKTTSVEATTEGPHGRAPEAYEYHGTLA